MAKMISPKQPAPRAFSGGAAFIARYRDRIRHQRLPIAWTEPVERSLTVRPQVSPQLQRPAEPVRVLVFATPDPNE